MAKENHIITTLRRRAFGEDGKLKYRDIRTKIKNYLNGRRLERRETNDKNA